MRKRLFQFLIPIGLLVGATGCSDQFFDCERGNRDVIEESRTVEPFVAISISNAFILDFRQADETTVTVHAEENIIDKVVTVVEGNTLILKKASNTCISEREDIRVVVTSPTLQAINLSGSGEVKVDTLNTDYLNLLLSGSGDFDIIADIDDLDAKISGSGRISLAGEGISSDLEISGSGTFDAFNFEQDQCQATIRGSGDIRVDVSEFLDAKISGSGDIIYQGNPVVTESVTGSGDVRRF